MGTSIVRIKRDGDSAPMFSAFAYAIHGIAIAAATVPMPAGPRQRGGRDPRTVSSGPAAKPAFAIEGAV
ncbi:hypothetical protein GCM10012320_26130 [Sinomonas cellulolyticus]|nr:hypothetical protein GCM10012320_26130 [Sinomonas sp. KCTC 49339]